MKNVSGLVCGWTKERPTASIGVRKGSKRRDLKRGKGFEVMRHGLERRKDAISSTEDTFGVRVELTFASQNCNFLDESIHLLRMQDKRRSMSSE